MAKKTAEVLTVSRHTAVKILLKSVIWAFALFGLLFILLLAVLFGLLRVDVGGAAAPLPEKIVLQIDFDAALAETRQDSLMTGLYGGSGASFFELSQVIAAAGTDDGVAAIAGRVGISDLSLAQVQELRSLIKQFRAGGKKAYLFSDGFGAFGGGTAEYYLASAFDEIIMQPGSEAGITGIGIEIPFLRRLLDKVGIMPEFYARYEYKNAFASFTDISMTALMKKELERLGGDLFNQVVADIAADRGIEPDRLTRLIDEAPLDAGRALREKLIDKTEYQEEMLARLEKEYDAGRADWTDYLTVLRPVGKGAPVIALIVLEGEIAAGDSILPSWEGEPVAGAASFISQLQDIAEIDKLKALVVRIDSPGGSYTAADAMRQALADFKEKTGVPVVVSMSSYAASGGYFAALPADKILAQPATLTASIGVLGGKPVLSGLWDKIGVSWDGVYFGSNAGVLSLNRPFNASEKKAFNRSLDNVYQDFTAKVAAARHIEPEALDRLARGRVFSGRQAAENGLIDALGGYKEAFVEAMRLAEIDVNTPVRVEVFPRPKTMQEKIAELMNATPLAAAQKLKMQIGLDKDTFGVLKRLKYDAVMPPMEITY